MTDYQYLVDQGLELADGTKYLANEFKVLQIPIPAKATCKLILITNCSLITNMFINYLMFQSQLGLLPDPDQELAAEHLVVVLLLLDDLHLHHDIANPFTSSSSCFDLGEGVIVGGYIRHH